MNDYLNNENELNLTCTDGFRCVTEEVHLGTQLLVTFQFGVESQPDKFYRRESAPLFESSASTDDMGALFRMKHLLTAVCRFLTAGGTFDEASRVFGLLHSELGDCALVVPADWELLSTFDRPDGWHHIFWRPEDGQAVVMIEDVLVTPSDVTAINYYIDHEE